MKEEKKQYTLKADKGIDVDSLTEDELFLIEAAIFSKQNFKDQSIVRAISKRYHVDFYDFNEGKVYICKN